ncbi:uncharacterized protein LOC117117273 [Anneissia japonica]|uniref:uncharacterized protein LOC117117273 n=1 Tax=Anneissia japonica TaxID=1529436 RepID=UPI0014257345|nr:uncharacterized protein LOC117117273 [Anneissia japonica]
MGILSIGNNVNYNNIANMIIQGPAIHSQQVTNFLKQNYKTPKECVYTSEFYQRRTSKELVSSYDANIWSGHYQRRKLQLKDGFFTPQHKAYQTIGQIQLDTKELVADVFQDGLENRANIHGRPPAKPSVKTQRSTGELAQSWHKDDVTEIELTKDKSRQKEEELATQTAGLTYIKQHLDDLEMAINRTQAGQQFQNCIHDIEHQRLLAASNQSQTQAISFCAPNSPSYTPQPHLKQSRGSQDRGLQIRSADSLRSGASTTSTIAIPVDEDQEAELAKLACERKKKAELDRLQCIIMVLNALHNMRTRDIRSRVPLSHETVKLLFRDVILDIHGRPIVRYVNYDFL